MKSYKIFYLFLIVGLINFTFTACNEEQENEVDGVGDNFIRLPDAANSSVLVGIDAKPGTITVPLAEILRDANSESSLKQPVTVTLKADPALIAAYNAGLMGDDTLNRVEALPASLFQADPLTVNFASGDFSKFFNIKLDPLKLDLTKKYALGYTIVSADNGYQVRNGLSSALYTFVIKNEYDGTYAAAGTRYNYDNLAAAGGGFPPAGFISTIPWSFDTDITTVNGNTSTVHVGQVNGGLGLMNITVNADNTVTITATDDTGVTSLVQFAGKPSTYDPATQTFELYYQWTNSNGTGTHRVVYEKLVRK